MKAKVIKPIKRSFEKHLETCLKRFPGMYHGKFARLMAIEHLLFRYGVGMVFLKDGSIIDVYEEPYSEWIKRKKEEWIEDKKKWEEKINEDKSSELYKIYAPYKKQVDRDYKRDKKYFDKFNPYIDRYAWMQNGGSQFYPKMEKVNMANNTHRSESCPINSYPQNTKPDILKAFIELLNHMIKTKQDIRWAQNKKAEIEDVLNKKKLKVKLNK